MNISFYLTFFLFSLGQIGRVSFFGQQANLYLYEIALVLSLFILILKYQFKPLTFFFQKFTSIYLFLFILFISLLFGINQYPLIANLTGFFYFVRVSTYFIYFFYFLYHQRTDKTFGLTLKRGIGLFAFITILITLVQYFFYPDLRNLIYLGWDPHLYRLFGVFFDSYVAASIFGLLFFYYLFKEKSKFKFVLAGIFFLFLIMTFSRMAYLSFLTALFLFLVFKKKYINILLTVLIFLILLVLIPKPFGEGVNLARIFTIESRISGYQSAFKIIEKKPILGVGYNRIRYEKLRMRIINNKDWQDTHAGSAFPSFLTILAAAGIIGLISFIFVLIELGKMSNEAGIYVIFLSLFSLSDNVLLHPFIMFLLLTILITIFKRPLKDRN